MQILIPLHGRTNGPKISERAVIPLYYTNGYYGIATSKEMVFMKAAKALLVLSAAEILLAGINLSADKRSWKEKAEELRNSLSMTEVCAICFGAVLCCSFLFTDYREEALWGAEGWYMGFLTQLALLASFFQIVHVWKKHLWIPAILFPVSLIQFFAGYLNRFGIYPIEMPGANPQFIAFIGNINWYCGYMVTVLFGAVYLVWSGIANRTWKKVFLYGYLLIGFASLVTQGSDSGILVLSGVLVLLFYLSLKDGKKMCSFWCVMLLLSAACFITWMIRQCMPTAVTYSEWTTEILTNTAFPVVLTIISAAMVFWLQERLKKDRYPQKMAVCCGRIATVILVISFIAIAVIMICNWLYPGMLGVLSEISLLRFSPQWGSERGTTWMAGISCFAQQGAGKKLIGIGPDCMGIYTIMDAGDELKELLREQFGGLKLTNAHNEWITVLADYGILGVGSYAGMLITAVIRYIKTGLKGKEPYMWVAGACGLGIFAYTLHNMVSFQQVTNVTVMYILMGIGEAYTKKEK